MGLLGGLALGFRKLEITSSRVLGWIEFLVLYKSRWSLRIGHCDSYSVGYSDVDAKDRSNRIRNIEFRLSALEASTKE